MVVQLTTMLGILYLFAIFGLTDGVDKSVFKAVKSGVEILKEIDKMKPYMQSMYGEDFEIGIGVHYGKVVVGEIGPGQKTKKTVIEVMLTSQVV